MIIIHSSLGQYKPLRLSQAILIPGSRPRLRDRISIHNFIKEELLLRKFCSDLSKSFGILSNALIIFFFLIKPQAHTLQMELHTLEWFNAHQNGFVRLSNTYFSNLHIYTLRYSVLA